MILLSFSCCKPDDKSIDCQAELGYVVITYIADTVNPKLITLTLTYEGSYTISVVWRFGDGTPDTVAGKTVTHTYPAAGSYDVEADITLSSPGESSCSGGKGKTIHVL